MRAAWFDRYGPPENVRVTDAPTPAPGAGEVLVRVHAAAVTSADSRVRGARFPKGFGPFARLVFGIARPRRRILGNSFSGLVEAVGPRVTRFRPGDAVCGMTGARMGAHAEYLAVADKRITAKPDTVSHDDAAGMLFGGTTALFFLRDKATVTPGTSVLVNGAAGAIGTNAVQLAKHAGAVVTGITSGPNTDLVKRLGADHIIDYTRHDPHTGTDRYDIVLDTVGNLSIATGRRLLTDDGVLLLAVGTLSENVRARGNIRTGTAPERPADFDHLLDLVASGNLEVVIDRAYDLADAAQAHAHVDTGHKIGNIVIRP